MKLVIVESPTKARTISKFLGKDFIIESSFGHVRDLPKSVLGIDIEKGFVPKYMVPTKAKPVVTKLKALAKKATEVILASDEDREGEAISWHLATILGLDTENAKRIVFHEITKPAILKALEHPRTLDEKLYNAQQARRVLDRLVGYELSPFLWKKVARGLSAGRVQSVALRLIVEREKEILAFKPVEYWSIRADFKIDAHNVIADLISVDDKKLDKLGIKTEAEAKELEEKLKTGSYKISAIDFRDAKKAAPVPLKTSTLQQTANRKLGWSAKQTMMVAQKLYEKGWITYMRTDSLNLSDKFLEDAGTWLKENLGEKYCLAEVKKFKTKSQGAQEAHEAIRPTEVTTEPTKALAELEAKEAKLYELIWSRSVATQMPPATFQETKVTISSKEADFQANGTILTFDGFLKIYKETISENELPKLTKGEKADLQDLKPEQHFTKGPARFSDATLVKDLEKHGVGRPSTYAPTISTLEARNYTERTEDKRLKPTEIAFIVSDLLSEHFPDIVNIDFTAKMEKNFDKIAAGKLEWQPVIEKFYTPFHANLELKTKELNKKDIMPEETTDHKCDKCGSAMVIKTGRYGKFLACSNFPDCKNTAQLNGDNKTIAEKTPETIELEKKYASEVCDKCGAPMAIKNGKFGAFLACTAYPKCKNIKNIQENQPADDLGLKCPTCGKGDIIAKKSRFGIFYACSNYPECKQAYWGKPTGEKCPTCGAFLIHGKKGGIVCSDKECGYKQ